MATSPWSCLPCASRSNPIPPKQTLSGGTLWKLQAFILQLNKPPSHSRVPLPMASWCMSLSLSITNTLGRVSTSSKVPPEGCLRLMDQPPVPPPRSNPPQASVDTPESPSKRASLTEAPHASLNLPCHVRRPPWRTRPRLDGSCHGEVAMETSWCWQRHCKTWSNAHALCTPP